MQPDDETYLRRTFSLARDARAAGHRPFGAVVADAAGIVAEAGSTQTATGDPTAHAEMNALRRAMAAAPRARLEGATLYASNEPCAMCAAAAFYAGMARIVFGFPEEKLRPLRNRTSLGAGIGLSCRAVLARPARKIAIVGPCLEDEAAALHDGYWSEARA